MYRALLGIDLLVILSKTKIGEPGFADFAAEEEEECHLHQLALLFLLQESSGKFIE